MGQVIQERLGRNQWVADLFRPAFSGFCSFLRDIISQNSPLTGEGLSLELE